MQTIDQQGLGEYRKLTPQEIGEFVKLSRTSAELKQVTLAVRANVSVRTIQRIEQGHKVDDGSLHDVADALGLQRDIFIRVNFVPDWEKLVKEAEKIRSNLLVADARPLASWRDFEPICHRVHGHVVDDTKVKEDVAEKTAALRDYLGDCIDISDVASSTNMVESYKEMMEMVTEIESQGYVARYAVFETDDRFRVSIVVFHDKSDPAQASVTQLLVPRKFTDMM